MNAAESVAAVVGAWSWTPRQLEILDEHIGELERDLGRRPSTGELFECMERRYFEEEEVGPLGPGDLALELAAIGAALQDIERRDPWAPVRAIDAEIADLRLAGASTYNARRRRSAAARAALGSR